MLAFTHPGFRSTGVARNFDWGGRASKWKKRRYFGDVT